MTHKASRSAIHYPSHQTNGSTLAQTSLFPSMSHLKLFHRSRKKNPHKISISLQGNAICHFTVLNECVQANLRSNKEIWPDIHARQAGLSLFMSDRSTYLLWQLQIHGGEERERVSGGGGGGGGIAPHGDSSMQWHECLGIEKAWPLLRKE